MQNPSLYSQINAQVQHPQAGVQFPEQEHLKCPRCDSANTKFCYYNNYNLSQPRHFCKNCKRYWTKGGTLRNIPVGGGSRKNTKRSSSSSSAADPDPSSAAAKRPASTPPASDKNITDSKGDEGKVTDEMPLKGDNFEGQFGGFLGASGSFGSLLGSAEGQYSNFLDGPSGLQMGGDNFCDPGSGQNMDPHGLESGSSNNADGFLNIPGGDGGGGWSGGSNAWPDLSMYTPGSNFL